MTDALKRSSDPEWEEMFDLSYELCHEIDAAIDAATKHCPPIWRACATQYVIEHLAERARFDIELPPRTPNAAPPEIEDVGGDE